MFQFIRRHQIWALVFIGLVIVSFVVFFSPNVRMPGAYGEVNLGSIKGEPITREDFSKALQEVRLRFFLSNRMWPDDERMLRQLGFDIEREAYTRLLIVEKLKELDVQVSTSAAADLIAEILRGDGGGPVPVERYNTFLREVLQPRGITSADLERFARNEIGIRHLIALYGANGRMITPQEAEFVYRHENQRFQVEMAVFSASNYLENVTVTPDAIGQFFTNRMAEYRVPEKRQVNYIELALTNYPVTEMEVLNRVKEANRQLAQMTDLSQVVDLVYQSRGTNFYTDNEGKPLPAEDARQQIRQELHDQAATLKARREAYDLLNAAFEAHEKDPQQTNALSQAAAARKLEVKQTAPFDSETGPEGMNVSDAFRNDAFRLTRTDPFSRQPIEGEEAVYILELAGIFPSQNQPFEAVTDKVTEDFRQVEARKLARRAGADFATTLTNALAQGKELEAVGKEAGVQTVSILPFAFSTVTHPQLDEHGISLSTVKETVARLRPGQASEFIASGDGGFVLSLKSIYPLDERRMQQELPRFTQRLAESRQYAAFAEWLQQAQQEMRLVTALRAPGEQ